MHPFAEKSPAGLIARKSVAFILVLASGVTGCFRASTIYDDADGAANKMNPCEQIADACHPLDQGPGVPHECHVLSHEGDENACRSALGECLAVCFDWTPPPRQTPAGDAGDVDYRDGRDDAQDGTAD